MLYREVPKTGEKLSVLGFGAMRLPALEGGAIDEERAIAQMRSAIDRGVNYVDTAWNYLGGESERIVGNMLKGGYREKVKVATKLPQWKVKSREDMDAFLNEQLEKLGVEYIDYYLIHALEGKSWDRIAAMGVVDFLDSALQSGKIRNAGFSFHGVVDDFKRIVDAYPWTFCQIQYNYLDQENQAGTKGLQYAASKGMAVMIMEPLRGGNISLPEPPPEVAELMDGAQTKRTPVEWALRWIWNHPEVTLVLSGMNEEAHIDQNIAIASVAEASSLSQAELDLVDRVAAKYKELMLVNCTGCAYCMPCPAGVRIPGCFEIYNSANMFKKSEAVAKYMYSVLLSDEITGQSAYASQCVECGQCVEHCPQHINIPEELAKVAAYMEDDQMQDRIKGALKV